MNHITSAEGHHPIHRKGSLANSKELERPVELDFSAFVDSEDSQNVSGNKKDLARTPSDGFNPISAFVTSRVIVEEHSINDPSNSLQRELSDGNIDIKSNTKVEAVFRIEKDAEYNPMEVNRANESLHHSCQTIQEHSAEASPESLCLLPSLQKNSKPSPQNEIVGGFDENLGSSATKISHNLNSHSAELEIPSSIPDTNSSESLTAQPFHLFRKKNIFNHTFLENSTKVSGENISNSFLSLMVHEKDAIPNNNNVEHGSHGATFTPDNHGAYIELLETKIISSYKQGTSQIKLQLEPEHLGFVEIDFEFSSNKTKINIAAEKPSTYEMLEQRSSMLISALGSTDGGIENLSLSFSMPEKKEDRNKRDQFDTKLTSDGNQPESDLLNFTLVQIPSRIVDLMA